MLYSHVDVCCISEAPACFNKVDVRGSWFSARLCSITSLDFITSKLVTQKSEGNVEGKHNTLHYVSTETPCSYLDHVSPSHCLQPDL